MSLCSTRKTWTFLLFFFLFFFFDLGRCKDACRENPSTSVLQRYHFPVKAHSFFSSPSIYLKVEEETTVSPQHQNMVFHKVSPTICILLSVLLLFLSQETLSRELIQVASYGKYFSSIMVLGFPVIASTLCRPAKFICGSGSCRR